MDNMELWNAVCTTDPKHTKKVNQRGGFTAIDAYYQVQAATKQFGPVGTGWGWKVNAWDYQIPKVVSADITMWYMIDGNKHEFDVSGACEYEARNGRIDSDGKKKALTDAITKGLSYLGFNSDVFTGKFDDNKYVNDVNRMFREEERKEGAAKPRGNPLVNGPIPGEQLTIPQQLERCNTPHEVMAVYNSCNKEDQDKYTPDFTAAKERIQALKKAS